MGGFLRHMTPSASVADAPHIAWMRVERNAKRVQSLSALSSFAHLTHLFFCQLRESVLTSKVRRSDTKASSIGVTVIAAGCRPFEIGRSIIRAVAVDVVRVFAWLPAKRGSNQSMHPAQLHAVVFAQEDLSITIARDEFSIASNAIALTSRYASNIAKVRDFVYALVAANGSPIFHAFILKQGAA